ncbi:unnamed protein product [Withania somnifera]
MGITSLQVCMDSANWLQDTIHEETEFYSSSSPSGSHIFSCSRPLIERKLRPQHDLPLKCPRCDSTHTKFCYYNNYSLSQPRYFCKSCRRYWTKGGTLRNIPKLSNDTITPHLQTPNNYHNVGSSSNYSEVAFSHFGNISNNNHNFMLENHHAPIDFLESKYEALVGTTTSRNQNFLGNDGFGSTFGLPMDGNINYEGQHITMNVKPNPKILSLEWHAQGCYNTGNIKESFGYLNGGLGLGTGLMNNGYGSSTTNPLV